MGCKQELCWKMTFNSIAFVKINSRDCQDVGLCWCREIPPLSGLNPHGEQEDILLHSTFLLVFMFPGITDQF